MTVSLDALSTMSIQEQGYKDFNERIWSASMAGPYPTRAQFEITYRCNIHCVHCYTDPFNSPVCLRRELSLEQIVEILDQLKEAGVLWLTLTGGEAVTHPQFKRIYRAAKARGFIVNLFSNATVITNEIADFLATDPPFKLEVSCHGATEETFDRITQIPGSFKRFREGIRRILDHGLPLRIKTKAMTLNRNELGEIKKFVENLGAAFNLYTTIYPRLNGDLSSTKYRLTPEETLHLQFRDGTIDEEEKDLCEIEPLAESRKGLQGPSDDRLFRCGCGTNSITINPYGILRACTFTTWPQYDLKTTALREAFDQLVREIRLARYEGKTPCKACPAYLFCEKNPAMALYEAGSMQAPVEYFCEVAFGKAEKFERQSASYAH